MAPGWSLWISGIITQRKISDRPSHPPSNKRASGCGRLRRPPTQPAESRWSRGREVVDSNKAGPGNEVIGPVRRP